MGTLAPTKHAVFLSGFSTVSGQGCAGSGGSVRESAGKAGRGGITRQGSSWLRWIMVEAAQVATRSSPAAKRYYERLARKLLIAVYALLHDGVVFDEEKFAAV